MADKDKRTAAIETVEDIKAPNFTAFISAARSGAQPAQIVGWAEKMETWATDTLDAAAELVGHLRQIEEELSDALQDGEDNAAHVAALAQLIRDAKRKISSGAEMLQYLDDHELWGPDETQANIPFHVLPGR